MKPFAYASPTSVEEALSLLPSEGWRGQEDGAARPLAGGTDLIPLLKSGLAAPARLVDVKRLEGIAGGIAETAGGVTLGALTTLAGVEQSALLQERYPALPQAAAVAATPQLRNMATIGGNLLQRPRCWYFRNPHLDCWLKGGDGCPAAEGQNQLHALFDAGPCHAVHPSDLATALHALDAAVRLRGPGGERTLPVADFFAPPEDARRTETVVRADELLLDVRLPGSPRGTRSTYLKAMDRKVWAFALVGVAAVLRLDGRRIAHARVTLGGVATVPWRAREAENLLHGADVDADETLFERAAAAALEGATPLAHNAYKVPIARTLVRRALAALAAA
jgi:xanthine dehydrogenase YagS FAD-binding subunit